MIRFPSALPAAICAAVLFLAATGARADEPRASPLPKPAAEAATVYTFGRENPDCAEWTDACQTCTRAPSGAAQCSTAGIACVPGVPICRAKKTP